nr:MAG TPA: PPR repeat [Bacteriophage sp.]
MPPICTNSYIETYHSYNSLICAICRLPYTHK